MSVRPYPTYRDSGVGWIGALPVGWQIKRLKRVAELQTQKADGRDFAVALENIEGWSGRFIHVEGNYEGEGTAFCAGDILFGKLRPYLAKAWLANRSGEAVGDFHVLRCTAGHRPEFLQSVILSQEVISLIDGSTYGAKMPRASWDFMGQMPVPIPPPDEQSAIAAFLDRETGKIDALVAEQERLMALLKEKRQAVISQAVTKGLNPNAKMKPSGVEWLGDVPEGWEVWPMKRLLAAPLAYGANQSADDDTPGNPRYVRITDIADEGRLRDETFRSLPTVIAESYLLVDGDILLTRSGATVGKSFRYQPSWGICCFAGYLIRARFNQSVVVVKFAEYFFSSHIYGAYIDSEQIQSTIPNVSAEKYGDMVMACPPLAAQTDIVEFLNGHVSHIDTLTAEATRAIALLKERRAALISAAVTGKIDLRDRAAAAQTAA